MKKAKGTKTLSFIIALVLVVTLVLGVLGGSISSASSSLRKENAKLKQQIEQVQKDNETLQDNNSKLTNDNNSLKDKNSLLESDKTTLQEEVSNMYNYQYSLNIDFYVDSTLYISGKARNGGTLLVSPTEPTKDGYNFKGWSKIENGEIIDLATTIFTTNTSLYAVFEEIGPHDNILVAGTYVFVKTPTLPTSRINFPETTYFKGYTLRADNTYTDLISVDSSSSYINEYEVYIHVNNINYFRASRGGWYTYSSYYASAQNSSFVVPYDDYSPSPEYVASDDTKLRTLVLSQDISVESDFFDWAITQGNLVYQNEA